MKTNRSHRLYLPTITKYQKVFYLFICLFSFNACLLNPIVHNLLFPEKNPSSKSLFGLLALLADSNSTVELNHSWAGIHKGDSLQLKAQYYLYGSKTDSTFQWSSSDNSVATVDANGLVQSIGNGKVWITATAADGRTNASSDITVYSGYVYTSMDLNDFVGFLSMNQTTGVLSSVGVYATGDGPTGIGVDPTGKFLFTANLYGGTFSQFLINQSTGALTANSIPTSSAGAAPRNLVITPDGRFLYLASEGNMEIRAFAINSDGTLTFLSAYPTAVPHNVIQISRNGNFIFYISPSLTEIVSYRINYNDGSLTQVGISPSFPSGGSGFVATHPNGRYLYVATSPTVTVLSFDKNTGQMAFVDSVFHGLSINGTAIHPSGNFFYLVHINEGEISCYTVDSKSGKISFSSKQSGLVGNVRYMIIDPSGRFAYVANNSGDIYQFTISQTTGELTLLGTVNPGHPQWNLTFL
ncbi:bacterial Ig-like domain, group 2 [Leptospira wolbachii serovar Codice str. CDC]|uniref:Bacterial Ig-like domain, group 2 n=1 Tax=Leptospira wolbachii serovar Codice str. CDC TaxID=1218599 RepID=R9A7I2_9LEPT|nr:beta-propeller fold lactonase family protein [Leptospira wolbachii]EOQ96200.1 bacterial Ig-like domain, group 2 [Leptospira wolbachii serovar Codice str. CDC]